MTNVGEWENSESPYGTFDQGGNLWEWNETLVNGSSRGLRGSSFRGGGLGLGDMHASARGGFSPTYEFSRFGFRVASSETISPNVTVITHGWQPIGGDGSPPPSWSLEMGIAILERAGGPGNIFVHDTRSNEPTFGDWIPLSDLGDPDYTWTNSNNPSDELVLVYNWVWDSNDSEDGWLQAAADNLFASLLDAPLGIGMNVLNGSLHFIGHSRGAVVNSLTTNLLGNYFDSFTVDQVTTLDPHPIRLGDGAGLIYEASDPEPLTYENVRYADNYYRGDGDYQIDGDFDGIYVPGATNIELVDAVLDVQPPVTGVEQGYGSEHSDVHLWYTATIDTTATELEDEDPFQAGVQPVPITAYMAANWWESSTVFVDPAAEPSSGRENVGYARSRVGGADRSNFQVTGGFVTTPPAQNVFNGDFSYGDTLFNEIPGWERHGGDGSGNLDEELIGTNQYLQLQDGDDFLRHNPLYFPPNAIGLEYDYWINNNDVFSPNDELQLLLGNSVIDTISLATETPGFVLDQQAMFSFSGSVPKIVET